MDAPHSVYYSLMETSASERPDALLQVITWTWEELLPEGFGRNFTMMSIWTNDIKDFTR